MRQARDHIVERDEFRSAARPALQLDLALGEALRPDDDLPGDADQVGGGELGAGALVPVVVEHVAARRREFAIEAGAGLVRGGVARS